MYHIYIYIYIYLHLLEKCMTLWGEREWNHGCTDNGEVACTGLSSECDLTFRPQNMTQEVQTHAPNRNCEPGNFSAKQSIRYITHGPIILWMYCTGIWCTYSLHQTGMDKMMHFRCTFCIVAWLTVSMLKS